MMKTKKGKTRNMEINAVLETSQNTAIITISTAEMGQR